MPRPLPAVIFGNNIKAICLMLQPEIIMRDQASLSIIALSSLAIIASACTMRGQQARSVSEQITVPRAVNTFDCAKLDYGIYWYGAAGAGQKSQAGLANPFFAPSKPTLIYTHGWNPKTFRTGEREDFSFFMPGKPQATDLADIWIRAGWNIGIFYWSQFGDEDRVGDAEQKLSQTTRPSGMRWRTCDGSFLDYLGEETVAKIYFKSFVDALQTYQGSHIRLVGHSLGSQLTMHLAQLVSKAVDTGDIAPNLMPRRVAQLDPWWSKPLGAQPAPAQQIQAIAKELSGKGVVLEMYKTSDILLNGRGDPNAALTALIGETKQIPTFMTYDNKAQEIGWRHVIAPKLYFLSYKDPPPPGCGTQQACDQVALSAATSDEQAKTLMNGAVTWRQVGGLATADTADDTFSRD